MTEIIIKNDWIWSPKEGGEGEKEAESEKREILLFINVGHSFVTRLKSEKTSSPFMAYKEQEFRDKSKGPEGNGLCA